MAFLRTALVTKILYSVAASRLKSRGGQVRSHGSSAGVRADRARLHGSGARGGAAEARWDDDKDVERIELEVGVSMRGD
jgi:hypothetical protein